MRLGIWGDRSSIGADQCKSLVIFIQISLTPGQVATDVCQALEYSTSGKPMYTSTKEFRPQSQKSCYQKTFWGWHTQYTPSRSPFSGPRDPQIAYYLAVTPLSDAMVFYAMGIFRFIFNICRNHSSQFSVPFNLAEVTSVSQFSLIMKTKIQVDWITFTYTADKHLVQEEFARKLNNLYYSSTCHTNLWCKDQSYKALIKGSDRA